MDRDILEEALDEMRKDANYIKKLALEGIQKMTPKEKNELLAEICVSMSNMEHRLKKLEKKNDANATSTTAS